jgi:hypothetical protein
MELKPGSRWKSAVCSAEVVVVRPPKQAVVLECGGHPVLPIAAEKPSGVAIAAEFSAGVHIGKRYVDAGSGLEVLASKPGSGSLSVGSHALPVKDAKTLPSSD